MIINIYIYPAPYAPYKYQNICRTQWCCLHSGHQHTQYKYTGIESYGAYGAYGAGIGATKRF